MPRLSLTLALLAGSLGPAPAPSLAAAAVPTRAATPLAVQDFEFLELVPSEEALGSDAAGKQLLRDTFARIAVEVELRGATEAAAEAELIAVARFLKGSAYDPELPPLDVLDLFWSQHATTRQAAGLEPLDREDPQVLQVLGARFGFDPQRLAPVQRQSDDLVPGPGEQTPSQPALTDEEVEAYLAANFEPTPSAVRDLVYATIGTDTDRIEALGVRASGTLAQLVLADLENPFVRPSSPNGRLRYDLPEEDPLLILSRVDAVAARRLVDDHLDRGGLGWAARILRLWAQQNFWSRTQEHVEMAERWLVRLLDWPQLHARLDDMVSWFYQSIAGREELTDSGRLSSRLIRFPAEAALPRTAIRASCAGENFDPAIAQLARHVGSHPGYAESFAIIAAVRAPEPSWVLELVDSPHPDVLWTLVQVLDEEAILAVTTAEARTAVAERLVHEVDAFPSHQSQSPYRAAFQEGAIYLTVPLVGPLATSESVYLRDSLVAPLEPADPFGVVAEALRVIPEAHASLGWKEFTNLAWVDDVLRSEEGLAMLREVLVNSEPEAFRRRVLAFGSARKSENFAVPFLALRGAGPGERSESLTIELVESFKGVPNALPDDHLEELLELTLRRAPEYVSSAYRSLTTEDREAPWAALALAQDTEQLIEARVLAMHAELRRASTEETVSLRPDQKQTVVDLLLHPDAHRAVGIAGVGWVGELGRALNDLRDVPPSTLKADQALLADLDFVRAVDARVLNDVIIGIGPQAAPVLLKRLAEGLPNFPKSHWIWSTLRGAPLEPAVLADVLAVLDRGLSPDKVMEVLADQADPALLPRFLAVFDGVPAAEGDTALKLRQAAIKGVGLIGTLEAAQALRELQRSAQLTTLEDAMVRTSLEQIAKRLEQERFWDLLSSGLPGRDEAAAQLLEQLDPANPASIRAAAAKALGALGAVRLQPQLIELLADPDGAVRAAAAEALDLIALQVRRDLESQD